MIVYSDRRYGHLRIQEIEAGRGLTFYQILKELLGISAT